MAPVITELHLIQEIELAELGVGEDIRLDIFCSGVLERQVPYQNVPVRAYKE